MYNIESLLDKNRTYYFVGIGGIGMSALARILIAHGYKVSGSDVKATDVTKGLESLGIHINYSQRAENIKDDFIVVRTDAAQAGNHEYDEAVRRQLTVYRRPELLSLLEQTKDMSIAVSGAHGKTTTSTMVAHLLTEAGQDPTCVIGGIVPQWQSNGRIGCGKQFVYEACEAFGNLVAYHPTHLIVTNIDRDHLEAYNNDYEQFKEYYVIYMNRVAEDEKHFVLANYDDAGIEGVMPKLHKNVKYFSFAKSNRDDSRITAKGGNIKPIQGGTSFEVELFASGEKYTVPIPLYGLHNVYNALAAFVMCSEFVEPQKLVAAFKNFKNSKRRFELMGRFNEANIYNDYAHLPAEVASAIEGARQSLTGSSRGKVVVAFQPHLQSRTKEHYLDFAKALLQADAVMLLPVYTPTGRVGEDLGITHDIIYNEMLRLKESGSKDCRAKQIVPAKEEKEFKPLLSDIVEAGDAVLLVGAGTIGDWYKQLV